MTEPADNGTYPEGVALKWAHDRRELFAQACRDWPGFMMKPGCELFVLLGDDEFRCWGHLRLLSKFDQIRELIFWRVEFEFSTGVRLVWPFADLEAAVHHWISFRDDFPGRIIGYGGDRRLELAKGYRNAPDNPGYREEP